MKKVVVLGAGMVGSVMACDLASDLDVTIADVREDALARAKTRAERAGRRLAIARADLSDPGAITRLVSSFDLAAGALASRLGYAALRAVIEAGKPYADISFFAEDALDLDDLAKARGVTAVVDCGVAPGMSHMIAGHEAAQMDSPESLAIYVGGLPRERRRPFEYKAGFAPSDVIEEYTRPTRLVERGEVVVREALTEPEALDIPGLGTLEAVNTDGLRSLVRTLRVPNMKEKTLRYPGHYDLMRVFRETGLFSTEPIEVGGVRVVPREVTSALMFPKWTYAPGEEDLTAMRITLEGSHEGRPRRVTWDLLDFFHRESGATSMSRTTAFPCTTVLRMLARGDVVGPGVLVPEFLGRRPGVLKHVIDEQKKRGVVYHRREE